MNKMLLILCYLPAAFLLLLYGSLAYISGFNSIEPCAWLFTALLFTGAYILGKNKWQGSLGGILTGLFFIYLSFQANGQVIDIERPLGIFFVVYYLLSGYLTFKNSAKDSFK